MEKTFRGLISTSSAEASLKLALIDEHIAILKLNRPAARNAIDRELCCRLAEAVIVIEHDPTINVALLAAEDPGFCSGADLKEVLAGHLNRLFTEEGGLGGFTHAPRAKPWIAVVEGAALAGGFELALSCDLLIASHGASFGLPEVKRGLMASAGGIYRLPRSIPRAVALEMIATGESISAEAAYRVGLVNRLVDQGQALDVAIGLGRKISGNAPLAVRESLAVARAAFDESDSSLYIIGDAAQSRLEKTDDFLEGSTAFLEKRPPKWAGR